METPTPKPSRLKKFVRRGLFTVVSLITLVMLLLAEENWRGARAWRNYKKEAEAKGESFDPATLIPPNVPDDKNLAMIPFFADETRDAGPMTGQPNKFKWPDNPKHAAGWPYGVAADLMGWAGSFQGPAADPVQAASTVLEYFQKNEPVLKELESARQRPYCRFSVPYEDWGNENVRNSTKEQFVRIKQLTRLLSLRAQAELVSGRPDQALDDLNLLFRLNQGLREEPLIMSQLVAFSSFGLLLQPLAEGLAEHRWNDAQLRALQDRLGQADLLASMSRAWRGDRDICANRFFNRGTIKPRGWDRLEQVHLNQAVQDFVLPRIDVARRRIDPAVSRSCNVAEAQISSGNGLADALIRHRVFARMMLPSSTNTAVLTAKQQTDIDEVMVSCALERYRLAEGHYPDTLEALVPRFAAGLPHDIITGQPLKYRRTDSGKFVLYSVGWNEKDDGGVVATKKDGSVDRTQGDWVFQYPD